MPYLSDLYGRIDAALADSAAARAECQAARAESEAVRSRCVALREESEAAQAKLVSIEDAFAKERFVLLKRLDWMLLLDRTSFVDEAIIKNGSWEEKQLGKLFSFIRAVHDFRGERYFLDCGAYWGLYCLSAYRTNWFNHIIAFEPDPLNRSQLHAQLAVNLLSSEIVVKGVALSDKTGLESFLKSGSHPTGNRAGVGLWPPDGGEKTVLVRTDTLDNQLPVENAILFIKMDVESAEVKALAGAKALLENNQIVLPS